MDKIDGETFGEWFRRINIPFTYKDKEGNVRLDSPWIFEYDFDKETFVVKQDINKHNAAVKKADKKEKK